MYTLNKYKYETDQIDDDFLISILDIWRIDFDGFLYPTRL